MGHFKEFYVKKHHNMSVFEYERDAIRVKARLRNANDDGESVRKFSVDPNLTSYETLRNLLSRAFDLCGEPASADFRLIYQFNNDQWLPLLSDWDLDAAIISASDPILVIEVCNTPYIVRQGGFFI